METTWSTGRACTRGDPRSGAVSDGRGLAAPPRDGPPPPPTHSHPRLSRPWLRPRPGTTVGPGAAGGAGPPVPIPNTAVKRPSADDTPGAGPRDNRPAPGPIPPLPPHPPL